MATMVRNEVTNSPPELQVEVKSKLCEVKPRCAEWTRSSVTLQIIGPAAHEVVISQPAALVVVAEVSHSRMNLKESTKLMAE